MSQRRFSRGPNDNDLSLEQRLVMQLSAAMNHDETVTHTDPAPDASQEKVDSNNNNNNNNSNQLVPHKTDGQHEHLDLSTLIGSLNNALGQRRLSGSSSMPSGHITFQDASQGTSSSHQALPGHSNDIGSHILDPVANELHTDPSQAVGSAPHLDLTNIDLSNIGNLKLSDLGILGNLWNSVTKHQSDDGSNHGGADQASKEPVHSLHHTDPSSQHNLSSPGQLSTNAITLDGVNALLNSLGNLGSIGNLGNFRNTNRIEDLQHHDSLGSGHIDASFASKSQVEHQQPQHHDLQHHESQHHESQHHDSQRHDLQHHDSQHHQPQHHQPQQRQLQHHPPQPEFHLDQANQTTHQGINFAGLNQPHHFQTSAQLSNAAQPEPSRIEASMHHQQSALHPTHSDLHTSGAKHTFPLSSDQASAPRESQFSWHDHIPTAIDPDVSSIQSVLQSLLTGATVPGVTDVDKDAKDTTESSEQGALTDPDHSSLSTASSTPAPTATDATTAHGFNLTDFGLGAEDRGLIETLRSAISISNAPTGQPSTGALGTPPSRFPNRLPPRSSTEFAERVLKPKASSSGVSKLKRTKASSKAIQSETHVTDHQTEFNASDTDTLRAIQQALLSAMGPLASSTSLAETLTSTAAAHSANAEIEARIAARASADTDILSRPGANLFPSSSSTASDSTQRRLAPAQPAKGQEPRVSKATAKKPLSKIVKPTEVDKQKLRDENAARKRKWREVHLMQNKDNDLRLRIAKRANEIYGDQDTSTKTQWIEEEFERRRQRRILRAGINSIVDAAKARAAKAAEDGDTGNSPLDYARMHISENARTLTQQSKQAASSHLSQLFKSSNAALEPQLHNEKVSVPLAPYMLVSSPKRPPYKFSWLKKKSGLGITSEKEPSPENAEKDAKSTAQPQDRGSEPNTEAQESSAKDATKETAETDSSQLASTTTKSVEKSDQVEAISKSPDAGKQSSNDKTDTEGKKPDEAKTDSSSNSNQENGSSSTESDKAGDSKKTETEIEAPSSNDVQSGIQPSKPAPEKPEEETTDARPKHRYSIVGSLRMGAPPNLASIYRRIRGMNPHEYMAREHSN